MYAWADLIGLGASSIKVCCKVDANAVTRNAILAVDIPYPLLKAWDEFLRLQKNESKISQHQLAVISVMQTRSTPMLIFSSIVFLVIPLP